MSKPSPWEAIPTPIVDFNVVRVANTNGVPIYWGKDISSQCLLIVELNGNLADQFRRNAVVLNGIGVDMRRSENGDRQRLVFTLARHVDTDLFRGLCETLIDSLRNIEDSQPALSVALTHLKRWKVFLSGRNARLLSPEEVRGLYAELHVLRRLYQETMPQGNAVEAWCGPDDSHHDFIFGNRAIEVKSLSGRERSSVRISSEDQLEPLVDDLFLLTVRLSEMSVSSSALSLNDLANLIENELTDGEALEEFENKLSGVGYVRLNDYEFPRFIVSSTQSYIVKDPFPRMIRSRLPGGVMKVRYDIKLEAITQFMCDDIEIFRRL